MTPQQLYKDDTLMSQLLRDFEYELDIKRALNRGMDPDDIRTIYYEHVEENNVRTVQVSPGVYRDIK